MPQVHSSERIRPKVLAADLVAYSPHTSGPQNRESHLQGIRMWNAAFKTRFTVDEQLAEEETVATRITMRAVHSEGDFQGLAPTGKEIEMGGISIERARGGKIVERRVQSDWLGMLQQMGFIPGAISTPSATEPAATTR
jgi:predicted ester cyclase